jgi:phage tail-like protein
MSRGTIPGLVTPLPVGELLPAVYQEEDPFLLAFTTGLDEVLAPILWTLDNLHAYLDPRTAPEDFLVWVASWLGAEVDEGAPAGRRRAGVAEALAVHRLRGTPQGLRRLVELVTGGDVELRDSGGVVASADPYAAPVGDPHPWVSIVVRSGDRPVRRGSLDALVREAKPAHVVHSVEVAGP